MSAVTEAPSSPSRSQLTHHHPLTDISPRQLYTAHYTQTLTGSESYLSSGVPEPVWPAPMSFFDAPFEGNPSRRDNNVNLSTSTSTSSTALLSSIRLERLARDKQRRQEHAALLIQRVWRGRRDVRRLKERLLDELERGDGGVGKLNMVLGGSGEAGRGRNARVDERVRGVLVLWVQRVMRGSQLAWRQQVG